MTEKQKKSLRTVIEYLEQDEKRNFEESGCPENHIYQHVQVLQECLDDQLFFVTPL